MEHIFNEVWQKKKSTSKKNWLSCVTDMWLGYGGKSNKARGIFCSKKHLLPFSQTTAYSDMAWFSSSSCESIQNLKICQETNCCVILRDMDIKTTSFHFEIIKRAVCM